MSGPPTGGRRERKKVETRTALLDTAARLFAEQGFAATTVKQITDAVDVAERTFFRYFDSKEDLLLPHVVALFEMLRAAVAERPLDEAPLTSIHAAATAVLCAGAAGGRLRPLAELDPTTTPVPGRLVRAFMEWEVGLAELLSDRFVALGADAGDPEVSFRASVAARVGVSAVRAAILRVRTGPVSAAALPGRLAATLDASFAYVEAGCAPPAARDARSRGETAIDR